MDAVGLCYGPVFPTPRVLHNLITPDLPRLARYLGTQCAVAAHLNEDNLVRHVESLSHRFAAFIDWPNPPIVGSSKYWH